MSTLRNLIVEMVEVHRVLGAMALEARINAALRPDVPMS